MHRLRRCTAILVALLLAQLALPGAARACAAHEPPDERGPAAAVVTEQEGRTEHAAHGGAAPARSESSCEAPESGDESCSQPMAPGACAAAGSCAPSAVARAGLSADAVAALDSPVAPVAARAPRSWTPPPDSPPPRA